MYNRMTKKTKFINDTYIHFYSYRDKWFLTVSYYSQSSDDSEVALYKTKSIECCIEEEGNQLFDSLTTVEDVISLASNEKYGGKNGQR